MQHKQSKTAAQAEDDDEYENDFEDYDDDFENFDEVKVAPPKAVSAIPVAAKSVEVIQRPSNQNFPMNTPSEAKKSSSGNISGAKGSRSGIGSSLSRSIADPRSVRIQRVLASNVLDLKLEKATLLNIPPSSKYDLYLSELRSADAPLKQIGVPTDNDTREIEVNTDEILFADKEVQFCNGDDTKFLNILKSIKIKRKQQSKDSFDNDSKLQLIEETRRTDSNEGDSFSAHSKLSEFLRRSSVAMEALLSETKSKIVDNNIAASRDQKLFNDISPWKEIGKDTKNGANELLRSRSISSIAFSEYQNDVFLTLHPYSVLDEDDLRPFKTLVGVWNCENIGAPAYVLEASGDLSAVSFSASQPHFVAAGATDGCIYLWDLREAAVNHQDRDSIDLKIQRGVRKPSFSAHSLSVPSLEETTIGQQALGEGDDDDWQFQSLHSAKVVSIISVASTAIASVATSSQFVSMDETGKIVFWVTQERRVAEEGSKDSLRASPWSIVSLVPTKTILSLRPSVGGIKSSSAISSQNNRNKVNGKTRMDDATFLFFAQEESCLLLPEADGKVSKVVRIGEPLPPSSYARSMSTEQIANGNAGRSSSDQRHSQQLDFKASSRVTCLAIRPALSPSQQSDADNKSSNIASDIFSSLLLMGREDGSIDLFRMDQQQPLLTWNIGDLLSSRSVGSDQLQRQRVVLLRWLPFHRSSFLALDGSGVLHHFDLQMDVYKPFRSESLGLSLSSAGALNHKSASLSFPHSSVESMNILISDSRRKFKTSMRQIFLSSLVQSSSNSVREETAFFENLARSTTAAAKEKRVVFGSISPESK